MVTTRCYSTLMNLYNESSTLTPTEQTVLHRRQEKKDPVALYRITAAGTAHTEPDIMVIGYLSKQPKDCSRVCSSSDEGYRPDPCKNLQ